MDVGGGHGHARVASLSLKIFTNAYANFHD